jgi:uncharacterized protein
MEIWNESIGVRLAWRVEMANQFWTRLRGWMGRAGFAEGAALIIKPCNSIHTWFMRAPIDVVFLNKESQVVRMLHAVSPFQVGPIVRGASTVVELPAGTLSASGTQHEDVLAFHFE